MAVLDVASLSPARGKAMKRGRVASGGEGRAVVAKKKQKKRKKASEGAAMASAAGDEHNPDGGILEAEDEVGDALTVSFSAKKKRKKKEHEGAVMGSAAVKDLKPEDGEVEAEEEVGAALAGSTSAENKRKKRKKASRGAGYAPGREWKPEDVEVEAEVEPEEEIGGTSPSGSMSGDVCQSLMERYARSSAAQHRHLCASAAAMRSFLRDEGIPLTPTAYFTVAIAAVCDANREDSETLSAISAFLSVLLPLVPPKSVPPLKAREAGSSLVVLLENSPTEKMAAPTVRSLVGSLGLLAQSLDMEDWAAVELPLSTLIRFSLDRRPKVRRCAQLSVVKVFGAFTSPIVFGKSSQAVLSLFHSHIPLAGKLSSVRDNAKSQKFEKPDNIEVLHVLNIVKLLIAHMPQKIARTCLPEVCKLLQSHISLLTRNVLGLLEVILQRLSGGFLESEAETVVCVLTSYLSSDEKNPIDTLCSASNLLKNTMNALHNSHPGIWIKHLSLVFRSMAGLFISTPSIGQHCACVLTDLISMDFHSLDELCGNSMQLLEGVIISLCSSCENVLSTSSSAPIEHILAVISNLFVKLGKHSYLYMSEIVRKLSSWMTSLDEGTNDLQNVQQCLGSAVVSMGLENMLSILPISFDLDKKTFSNKWLIPILKKNTVGASIQYFLEHIVPLARSAEDKYITVHRSATKKKLVAYVDALWSLLPAFCHYPTDTADNFGSLAKILLKKLKKDQSSHVLISVAIKGLVDENKSQLKVNAHQSTDLIGSNCGEEAGCVPERYPREVAQKNIEVLASNSMEIFKLFTDIFFDSPLEKRAVLKEVIGRLASILSKIYLQSFFSSLLVKLGLNDNSDNGREPQKHVKEDMMEERIRLVLEILSAFAEGADQDFVVILFDYIKPHLLDDGPCQFEAFQSLSEILKENSRFIYAQFDQLMDLLIGLESVVDVRIIRCRLTCLHFMFVHLLKGNEETTNRQALLILNEIIRFLRDSNEEVRKSAFDTLLDISQSLQNSEPSTSQLHHQQLFQMIMGYLSGSPPQITSVAIASISLLIYKDAHLYYLVPDLIPTVLALLQNKANEITKAVLGLVKVLVTSLPTTEIRNILPDILSGILPWSSVSKNHFRSKVKLIVEILTRKCGIDSVLLHVPENFEGFVKLIAESKQKARSAGAASRSEPHPVDDSSNKRKSVRAWDSKRMPRGHKRTQQDHEERPDKFGRGQVKDGQKRNKFGSLGGKQYRSSEGQRKGPSQRRNKTEPNNRGKRTHKKLIAKKKDFVSS